MVNKALVIQTIILSVLAIDVGINGTAKSGCAKQRAGKSLRMPLAGSLVTAVYSMED